MSICENYILKVVMDVNINNFLIKVLRVSIVSYNLLIRHKSSVITIISLQIMTLNSTTSIKSASLTNEEDSKST